MAIFANFLSCTFNLRPLARFTFCVVRFTTPQTCYEQYVHGTCPAVMPGLNAALMLQMCRSSMLHNFKSSLLKILQPKESSSFHVMISPIQFALAKKSSATKPFEDLQTSTTFAWIPPITQLLLGVTMQSLSFTKPRRRTMMLTSAL